MINSDVKVKISNNIKMTEKNLNSGIKKRIIESLWFH